MKKTASLFFFFFIFTILQADSQTPMMQKNSKELTMLSLGDSYTIGERVDEADRFPNQTVLLLHSKGIYFEKPKIIAITGWTTDELIHAIQRENIKQTYDFVTLLIGVNNQYRGRSAEEYRKEFVQLLEMAITFSGNKKNHVIVLSIPDWGATPFAEGSDRKKVAAEIDLFNSINKEESLKYGVHYIDITPITRKVSDDPSLIAEDGLHPSGKMYGKWAVMLGDVIEKEMR
jgi:lysophospholipase L1-like esterase